MRRQHSVDLLLTGSALAAGLLLEATAARAVPSISCNGDVVSLSNVVGR